MDFYRLRISVDFGRDSFFSHYVNVSCEPSLGLQLIEIMVSIFVIVR